MGFWEALGHFANAAGVADNQRKREAASKRIKVEKSTGKRIQFSGLGSTGQPAATPEPSASPESCRCSGKR